MLGIYGERFWIFALRFVALLRVRRAKKEPRERFHLRDPRRRRRRRPGTAINLRWKRIERAKESERDGRMGFVFEIADLARWLREQEASECR